ncbi:MAG: hypothetical protein ACUVXF_04550, partial [Desulfobaccales bacterium]
MITAETIRQALRCDNPSCACHKPTGLVHCPAHDPARQDKTPSLSLNEKDGKVLCHYFNGCSQVAVVEALRAKGLWPSAREYNFVKKGKRNISTGKGCNTATPPGLTLERLAKTKGLQIDGPKGLAAWGVAQQKYCGATAVRIPYFATDGQEIAVRYR